MLGPEKALYMMKYSTKNQLEIENPWAIHLHAINRAERVRTESEDSPEVAGRRRIQSICCTLSNPHEISAPMACLYLCNGSAVYSSHSFVKLSLKAILHVFINQEPVDVMLERDSSGQSLRPASIWLDYAYRPESLATLNLVSFIKQWERKNNQRGKLFLVEHPLFGSHSLAQRQDNTIASVFHRRLPDIRQDSLCPDELERFQRTLLILFRPFRDRKDFDPREETFTAFFERWWRHDAPEAARNYVKNNKDYYVSMEVTKKRADPDLTRYDSCAVDIDDDDLGIDRFDATTGINASDSSDCLSDDEDEDEIMGEHAVPQPLKHISMLAKSEASSTLAATSTMGAVPTVHLPTMTEENVQALFNIVPNPANTIHEPRRSDASTQAYFSDLETRVKLLEQALGSDLSQQSAGPLVGLASRQQISDTIHGQPSLQHVSEAFALNAKQHKAFMMAGTKLITSLILGHKPENQMIAFLGGLPGAGKSRVIAALQTLAMKWGNAEAVATAAYQGVAAQAVDGVTIHKLFGWGINRRRKWTPTRDQVERFAKLKLLIVDEISTCDVKILGLIDSSLRQLTGRVSILFGGVHVFLVGDWL